MTGLYTQLCLRKDLTQQKIYQFSVRLHDATSIQDRMKYLHIIAKLERRRDELNSLAFYALEQSKMNQNKAV